VMGLVLGLAVRSGIIGRGTCVVRARRVEKTKDSGIDDDVWDGPLIVKLSWPAKSRIRIRERHNREGPQRR
jgi:hypothetical protein